MTLKLIGAAMILLGCGGFGFSMASAHIREESGLKHLIRVLEWMELELSSNLTPLPELCSCASEIVPEPLRQYLSSLARLLDTQTMPDPMTCAQYILSDLPGIGPILIRHLQELGTSLGRFDLAGQLQGLRSLRQQAELSLKELSNNRQNRLRSYQTLGLCAGAALAILFL